MSKSFQTRMLRWRFNLLPAFRRTGGRITYISHDPTNGEGVRKHGAYRASQFDNPAIGRLFTSTHSNPCALCEEIAPAA